MRDEARKLIERIGDWDGADHYEDCPAVAHGCGDCACTEAENDDGTCEDRAEEQCDCYLGVMRGSRSALRSLLDENARLSAEVEAARRALAPEMIDALQMQRERAESAEAKVAEWQDMAYRERDRADEHDSARQSEKERADYAEAKVRELGQAHKDALAQWQDEIRMRREAEAKLAEAEACMEREERFPAEARIRKLETELVEAKDIEHRARVAATEADEDRILAEEERDAAREQVRVLRQALRELLNAVKFKTPTVEYGRDNWCWEARVPVAFVTEAEAALRAPEDPKP